MLLQVAGDETVIAQRPNYLTDAVFKGQADPNPFHTKEDDDDLAPQQVQRRYKRRKKRGISTLTEIEDLKQQLKNAIKDAQDATKEAHEAKQKIDKLTSDGEAKSASNLLDLLKKKDGDKEPIDLFKKHDDKKTTDESEEPWGT